MYDHTQIDCTGDVRIECQSKHEDIAHVRNEHGVHADIACNDIFKFMRILAADKFKGCYMFQSKEHAYQDDLLLSTLLL